METIQSVQQVKGRELQAGAAAAGAKALIEAKFMVAMGRPRSVLNARASILDACKREQFAKGAIYKLPRRKKTDEGRWETIFIEGLSIRFAEQALNSWRNVDVTSSTTWEDDQQRMVRVTVTDLEANLSYSSEVLLNKTVERGSLKDGKFALSTRLNTDGKPVYLVATTEDDLRIKLNAETSRAIRNSGLRLIPQDILEEAEDAIRETLSKGGEDPKQATKKVCDAFTSIGVAPVELEVYLGHSIETVSPKELSDLRIIFGTIRDGESSWKDYIGKPAIKKESKPAEPDEIPGAELPLKTGPVLTPSQKLSDAVTAAGYTFADFKAWAIETGNVTEAESLAAFEDIPPDVATRIHRARKGLLLQMAAAKGGAK